jgi:iron complex outermembrane receptor protein
VARYKGLTLAQLMEIEVTSVSRQREPLSESPSAIQVITGEEIRRSGASGIAEALRLADNLAVAQKNAHDWAISARGFNTDLANKLLVMVDGRSVYTPLFSGVFWNQQDYLLEDIDRIEVVSGPGGTLWGANAVNGVVSIITKSAADTHGGFLEAGGGAPLERFIGGRYGGAIAAEAHLRGYAKYFERDDEVLPSGLDAGDSWHMGQGGFRLDVGSSAKDLITVKGDLFVGRERLSTGGVAEFGGGNLLGKWSRQFSDESRTSLQAYYDRTHLVQPVPALVLNGSTFAPAGVLKDDLDTLDIDFQHQVRLKQKHRLVWGLGYRFTHNVVANAPGLAFVPPTLDRSLFSAFAQDQIDVSTDVAFVIGSKVEHNSYTGVELEPSARLRWTISSKHILWAAVSRAVRMPSRVDRHERLPTPALAPLIPNLLVGGENFQSETVVSYETGLRGQVAGRLSASVAGYYNRYGRLRSTSPSPPPAVAGLPLFFENNLEGETRGVEMSLDYQPREWWRLHAGGALFGQDIRVEAGKVDFNQALNETADPGRRFSLRSSMNLVRSLELDLGFRHVGSFRYNNGGVPAEVPGYHDLDAHLLWHASGKLDVSIAGQNLLRDQHLEYVISSPNPRVEIRRGLYGKLVLRW